MRQSAKWALLGVGLLAFSALAVGVILVLVIGGARVPGNAVLTIRVSGKLVDHDTRSSIEQVIGGEIDTLTEIIDSIERGAKDPRIKAIYFRIGEIDAGWARAQELRSAITDFRSAGKPVLAHLEAGGTQEYFVASGADRLYLMPGGMLMTTGLLADAAFFKGTLDKLKIRAEMEHVGAYKSAAETFTRDSMSEAQREATNAILDSIYSQIVDGIAKTRKLTPAEVRRAIDEGLLTPARAKSLKLVDDLLYADQVEDELSKRFGNYAEVKLRSYKKSGSLRLGRRNRIAVISASGAIISGKSGTGSFGGEFIGSDSMVRLLKDVREDGGIRAVVLRVDSPGGSGVASDAIWRETQLLKESKPLVVSMGDVAASGGYYMSMGADAIVADPATITGSIGVISGKFNMRGFYEDWLGLHRDQLKRGENADLFSDYEGFTDAQRAKVRAQIEDFYIGFVHKAAEGRGRKDEEIDRIAQGRIWSGEQAKENGLVDELGGLRKAIEIAKEKAKIPASESVSVEMYPRRRGFFQALSGGDDDTFARLLSPRVSLPARLGEILSELEVRERIVRDGPVLWAGEL